MNETKTAYRHVVRNPGIRGGRPIVKGTRIGVHDVAAYHVLKTSIEEIQGCFPDLTLGQIYECLAYFEDHKDDMMPWILEQLGSNES